MTRILQILSLAAVVSLALTSHCLAKDATAVAAVQGQQQPAAPTPSLASKLLPKARSARSIGDMFEKMKNKLFGRKQASATSSANAGAASQQVQSVAPSSAIRPQQQQQPQWDLSAINQQYSPYPVLGSNYQWPSSAGSANQYLSQYSPMQGFTGASSFSDPSLMSSMGIQSVGQSPQQASQAGSVGGSQGASQSNGGILSSASQLIAQYLSPSSASSSQSTGSQASGQQGQQSANGQQQQQQALTPQQSQYNEFASLMDAMVAQTGVGSQRQPTQYLGGSMSPAGPQQQQQQSSAQQQPQQQQAYGMMPQQQGVVGDQDMSGSSSVQSYMPAASAQPASQKSSMVSLAEQLAPGANFNKLVSFPFSLSSNDDTSKEGRYKLHIPFLNTHVKRSDQQAASVSQRQQQQQQQQYISSYLSQQQQQQYAASQAAQQQLAAQASQIVPTIVSPQSAASQSVSQQSSAAVVSGSQSAGAQPQSSSSVSQSQSVQASPSVSSSVSSSSSSSSVSSAVAPSSSSSNSRPAWSVADVQSGSSSSKLIPMSSSASSSSSADEDQSSAAASQRS